MAKYLLRRISAGEFVNRIHLAHRSNSATDYSPQSEKRFAFFLGAGCSVSSGIPTAAQLVRSAKADDDWLRRYRNLNNPNIKDENLDDWARQALRTWSPDSPGSSYGELIELLFLTPGERQREIERLCSGKVPGFGYTVLSSLMCLRDGAFSAVLTTNFDDLIAESFFRFQLDRPMVINHDSLAPFIRPTHTRPLLIKLHGDHRLAPRNTASETEVLDRTVAARVATVLHDRGLVFVGYGGNDESILRMLETLPEEAIPYGVYWVSQHEPRGLFRRWLERRDAIWVECQDFDLLMLLVKRSFDFPDPTDSIIQKVISQVHTAQKQLVKTFISQWLENTELLSAMNWMMRVLGDDVVLESRAMLEEFFKHAILIHPQNGMLLSNYAGFVALVKKDVSAADALYVQALAASPDNPDILGDYALFLANSKNDIDKADELYRRALVASPRHANNLRNFAVFRAYKANDSVEAEELFQRCASTESRTASHLHVFAKFLDRKVHKYDRAEALYLEALRLEPSNALISGDYALFLDTRRERFNEAEELYEKVCNSAARSPDAMGNYAYFLCRRRANHDGANKWFMRALEVDPNHANNLGNYGWFLSTVRRDDRRAEEYYLRSLEEDPNHAGHLTNYALLLHSRLGRTDDALAYLKHAIRSEPQDSRALSVYAEMLLDSGGGSDEVEEWFEKAAACEERFVPGLQSYAAFLVNVRGDSEGAERLVRECVKLEPSQVSHLLVLAEMRAKAGDVDEAEECVKKAVEISESRDARCLAFYGEVLRRYRGENERAEELFKRALAIDSTECACHCWYGVLLQQAKGDLAGAEHHYRRALEGNDIDTAFLLNLAQLVLARGATAEGMEMVATVRNRLSKAKVGPVALECELYCFLHGPREKRRESLRELRTLLDSGIRSVGWNFAPNVEQSIRRERHLDSHWLTKLASVCDGTEDIKILAKWKRWKEAI